MLVMLFFIVVFMVASVWMGRKLHGVAKSQNRVLEDGTNSNFKRTSGGIRVENNAIPRDEKGRYVEKDFLMVFFQWVGLQLKNRKKKKEENIK